jgi:hypothetical protein
MKRTLFAFLLLACASLIPSLSSAAQIRTFVAEFAVTPPEAAGLKPVLQTLLASRLASDALAPVASATEADVIITGSYTQFGKVFSIDALAKLASGKTLATVFEQGESQDDLIPALGKISAKLKAEILQRYPQAGAAAVAAPAATAVQAPQAASQLGATAWLSQRIANAQLGLAPALTGSAQPEYFIAETHALRLYRQEKALKLLAEVNLPLNEKVVGIDSVGPDKNGNPRVYVTIIDGEIPASKIYTYQSGQLKPVAVKLPYMFRSIALNGGPARMYAQEMGNTEDFYGDLYPLNDDGSAPDRQHPIKLPRYANIFNYNTVPGPDGKSYPVVLNGDGYLVVYSDAGEELWRSTEKFGGSETYFQRETGASVRETYDKFRWRFIDQRITVTAGGEIIVPQNAGFFVIGNNRSYSKYSLVSFTWNGASIEERWRTKQSQDYLADYYLQPASGELVLLEVVQKEGPFAKGGSVVRVMRTN